MDEFKYNLELAKIDACKYVKDIRNLLYNYYNDFHINYWRNSDSLNETDIRHYHLYSKTYTKFLNTSTTQLPEKFETKFINFQSMLLNEFTNSKETDYQQFMDIFQFTEHITIPGLFQKQFYRLCSAIGNNPLPFKISLEVSTRTLTASGYFTNLSYPKEFTILTWMKMNNIPESNSLAQIFRQQYRYQNTQESHDEALTERANLVLAIKALDQLTGVPIE